MNEVSIYSMPDTKHRVPALHPAAIRPATSRRSVRAERDEDADDRLRYDREAFVTAMRGAVTGVNVVTTDGPAGRFGLTVSAFSSVSADPPTVLVCINRASPANGAIERNGRFCVNVLSVEQNDVADSFAGRPVAGRPYDFSLARWQSSVAGSPALDEATARFDCVVETAVHSGSHTIFIGRVIDATTSTKLALMYRDRRYGRPCVHEPLDQ